MTEEEYQHVLDTLKLHFRLFKAAYGNSAPIMSLYEATEKAIEILEKTNEQT